MRWIYRSSNYGVVIKVWITHLFSSLLTLLLNLLYPINDSLQYLFYCRQQSLEELPKNKYSKFVGQHLLQSLFLRKLHVPQSLLWIKLKAFVRLWYRYFPMNFAKSLRTPFFTEKLRVTVSVIYEWFIIFIYLRTENFHPQTFIK